MGTTHIKAALVDDEGRILVSSSVKTPPFSDWNGFMTFDVKAYVRRAFKAVKETVSAHKASIEAVAITSQRATVVPVGRDGTPVGPGISWQDMSGGKEMDGFANAFAPLVYSRESGLPVSALWTLAKLLRLKRNFRAEYATVSRFALLHDYMLLQLGATEFITDPSNASATGLMNVKARQWSEPILDLAGIDRCLLPEIRPSGALVGTVSGRAARHTGLTAGIPLINGGGDQQCAALGAGAIDVGNVSLCLGTAGVLSCPLKKPVTNTGGSFFCTAHVVEKRWILEGIMNSFGSCLSWLADMANIGSLDDLDGLAGEAPPGAQGLVFLPFLAGIGSPDYNAIARGGFTGLTLKHGSSHLARSVVEGISYEMKRILDAADSFTNTERILTSGGGPAGPKSFAIFSEILGRQVCPLRNPNTSILGTAMLAWTGAGLFPGIPEASARLAPAVGRPLKAKGNAEQYKAHYAEYLRNVAFLKRGTP